MITYKDILNSNHDIESVAVFLEGRRAGTIQRGTGGWYYQPRTGCVCNCGETLGTITDVKRTLEAN